MNLSEHLEHFRKQYPQIRPFEEDDDVEWWNEGLDLMRVGKLDQAGETFAKLILAQPEHSDGFNGLGLVYEKRNDRPHAELFLREAIRQAEQMVQEGSMDVKALDIIRADLDRVLKL